MLFCSPTTIINLDINSCIKILGLLPNNAICISQPQQQQQQMLQRPQHRFSMESIPIDQTQTSPQSACGAGYVGQF